MTAARSRFRHVRISHRRTPSSAGATAWGVLLCVLASGCGYTTRPGLASHLKTIYIKPFVNKIDVTQLTTGDERFPIYRHRMEVDITNAVINRFQFTGLMRPASAQHADARLEGELAEFRRDALRYDASQQVEEWRLSVIAHITFTDLTTGTVMWDEPGLTGDKIGRAHV